MESGCINKGKHSRLSHVIKASCTNEVTRSVFKEEKVEVFDNLPRAHLSLTNVQAICSTLQTLLFSPASRNNVHIYLWLEN